MEWWQILGLMALPLVIIAILLVIVAAILYTKAWLVHVIFDGDGLRWYKPLLFIILIPFWLVCQVIEIFTGAMILHSAKGARDWWHKD